MRPAIHDDEPSSCIGRVKSAITFENQSFRASGLSLITAAIVHWNTVYLRRAVQHLRAQDVSVPADLLPHVAPLGWDHIALTGDYVWTDTHPASAFSPLNDVRATFQARGAQRAVLDKSCSDPTEGARSRSSWRRSAPRRVQQRAD